MDAMNYYTKSNIGLKEIDKLAISCGYTTKSSPSEEAILYIFFGAEHQMRWEWSEDEISKLSMEDDARDRLVTLNPTTILILEYYPKWLPEIVSFMKIVMGKYSGWLDCKGDVDVMYTLDNIDGIISGCP